MTILFLLAALVAYAILADCCDRVHEVCQTEFNRKFPLISDKEFLARSSPGTNPIVALAVRRAISDSLGIEYARIHPSASLVNDYGAC
jgi:hypothetical protein